MTGLLYIDKFIKTDKSICLFAFQIFHQLQRRNFKEADDTFSAHCLLYKVLMYKLCTLSVKVTCANTIHSAVTGKNASGLIYLASAPRVSKKYKIKHV